MPSPLDRFAPRRPMRATLADAPPAPAAAPSGLERWRARSDRVRALRMATPWVMGAIVALVLGWLGVRAMIQAFKPTTPGAQIHMTSPRFIGRDDHGKPYVLGATRAVRDPANPDVIHLVNADMSLDAGRARPATLRGNVAAFNEATRILALKGDVVFTDGAGYVFQSDIAKIDTDTLEVRGYAEVYGQGPLGTTRSLSYAIHDRGQRVVFTGDVHSHLYNGSPPQ